MANRMTNSKATIRIHAGPAGNPHHPLIEVTPDRIRIRAYEIFQSRAGIPGDAASDWLQAENELLTHNRKIVEGAVARANPSKQAKAMAA